MKKTFTTYALKLSDDTMLFDSKTALINYIQLYMPSNVIGVTVQTFSVENYGHIVIDINQEYTLPMYTHNYNKLYNEYEIATDKHIDALFSGREYEALKYQKDANIAYNRLTQYVYNCFNNLIDMGE